MRRKFLSVVLCVCMMMTMAPFAFAAEGKPSSSGGSASSTFDGLITTADALQNAINTATDDTTITVSGTIEISAPIDIDDTITITGTDNAEIKASSEFSGGYLIGLKTADKTLTLGNIKLDAKEKARVVYCSAGSLVVDGATITGGKTASSYIGGVYMTDNSVFEMDSGSITGNKVSDRYESDGYLQYSADLWIGANVSADLAGGEVGNVFVNANSYSETDPGFFIMQAGHVTNLYAEYCDTYGAQVIYGASTLDHLYLSTAKGNGDKVEITSRVIGTTYKGGVTNADEMSPVAMIGETGYATLALAIEMATSGDTIVMAKDTTVLDEINFYDKKITLDLNGTTITANFGAQDYSSVIEAQGNDAALTIEDNSKGATGKIVSNHYGVSASRGAYITVNSGTIEGGDCAALSGNNTTGNMNFIVNGGTLSAHQGPAIYQSGQCKLTVTGGTLNGGISLRMGQVNISGGTINATTGSIDSINEYYNKSGNIWLADALYVFGGTYDKGDTQHKNSLNLNITGGTFNCSNGQGSAVAIYDIGKVAQSANITISGNAKFSTNASDRSAYQVLSLTDLGVKNPAEGYNQNNLVGKVTSSITGGYFTTDPTAYLATGKGLVDSDLAGYYKVGDSTVDVDTEVKAGAPSVSIPTNSGLTEDDVKSAATSQATQASLAKAASSLTSNQSIVGTKEDAKKALGDKVQGDQPITVVVQPYLDVKVVEVNNDAATMSVNISALYNVIATTDPDNIRLSTEGENAANAVTLKEKQAMSVSKPVTIKLPLPSSFGTTGNKLSIKHTKGNGSVEYYTGTVTTDENSNKFVTFTTNGFSPFVIYAASANVASIGDDPNQKVYPTLQAAIDAVQNNETITLLKNTNENVTVSKPIKFTLAGKDHLKGSIAAGSRYSMTTSETTSDNTKYTFTYVGGGSSSSISTPTTYNVNVNAATNGAVAADKKTASKGTTVTVTASPSKGYVVDAVKVVDKDGKDVAVTGKDGKYVFTMPASAVTVTGSFKAETPAPVALPFTDVKSGNWFYDAVKYAYEQGLMTGTSATTFAPNGTMNRAMIVTVLYRLEKSPAVTGASKFTDVPAGQWYSDAVAWAAANKIVNGYDETTFGPMNAVTREQMAAILFRYEQVKGLENVTLEENLNRFPDQNKISAYAIPALQWAVGQKIINGNTDGTLDPTGTATRAQVAQIFTNLLNK